MRYGGAGCVKWNEVRWVREVRWSGMGWGKMGWRGAELVK